LNGVMLFTLNQLVELMKIGVKTHILAHTCEAGWVAFAYIL